ncbi:MAG: hypothetical protein WD602_07615 [Actinomycetota bacterium]
MPEFARKYIWLGAAGGLLQFTLIALIAFSGSEEPSSPPERSTVAESRTSEQASGAPSTNQPSSDTTSSRETDEPGDRLQVDGPPKLSETQAAASVNPGARSDTGGNDSTEDAGRATPATDAPDELQETTEDVPAEKPAATPEEKPAPAERASAPARLNKASVEDLIREVFKEQGDKAVQVARCESELKTDARRGQFFGLFQMGANERASYGHGQDALAQIEAAHDLFMARGWQPWTCA